MADPIDGQQAGQQQTGDAAQSAGKTFTQAELDRLIGERLTREREQHKSQLAEFEAAKAKAAKLDELENANKSEAEKVAAAIKDRDARIEAAEKKAQEAEARSIGLMRQARVTTAAMTLGAYDASDPNFTQAVAAIDPASEKADAEIKAAIEALKASKPYLFRPPGSQGLAAFNPGSGQGAALTDAQRVANVLNPRGGRDYGPLGR